jgi:Cu+-exporting ATPase
MDSLIAVGSSAAFVYGIFAIFRISYGLGHNDMDLVMRFSHDVYFESGATILTLITLGKYLEAKSKSRTSDALTKLMDLAPKSAIVLLDGVEKELFVDELKLGDIIVIKSGYRIPVDGLVLSGSASVDESALTGESMPVFKEIGDRVISASINQSGYFTFKATKVGKDTTLSQIIQLVEDASSTKAPISKLADQISSIFVPIVILISILSMVVWSLLGYPFDFVLSIGIAVLVISCPCALGLATPVAIMVGTGKGAESGLLFKSAESLEKLSKANTIVFDKTGTLTDGKPRVINIYCNEHFQENDILQIAYSIEILSEHPLAIAIIKEAESRSIPFVAVNGFYTFPGKGIKGTIINKEYIVGNIRLMNEESVEFMHFQKEIEMLTKEGQTALIVAEDKTAIAVIAVADVLKPESKAVIKQLYEMGKEIIMLTGDHRNTALFIQQQLADIKVISEVLPVDKESEIAKLQKSGKIVAMVGDGINDAPALMRSDIGIAIGNGSDIAIESADIVLMRSDLTDLVSTFQLSKSVMKNIKQNLFWAFFYNIIGIPLAAGVFYFILGWKLNPMFAAAAMSLSSVTVVLNALRLLRFKPSIKTSSTIETVTIETKIENKKNMKTKTLTISGMSCGHCSARVESTLNAIDGVEARVNLETNTAKITVSENISDKLLKDSIEKIGYSVTKITE